MATASRSLSEPYETAGGDTVPRTVKNSLSTVPVAAVAADGSSLERRLDLRRQRWADAGHGGNLLDGRIPDALDRPEHLQQLALALGTDARQLVERRPHRALV